MSYFLFGTFNGVKNKEIMQQIKNYAKERAVYIWFDEEITFYEDIYRMLNEQKAYGKIVFAVTSENQPYNSSDVLFPFDKYDSKELLADKTRAFLKKCCRDNINILFDCLNNMINLFKISHVEIFVVEGYDDSFQKIECSLDGMKENIIKQLEENLAINSIVYYI